MYIVIMKTTMMKAIVGTMMPMVFLCNTNAGKKVKRNKSNHDEEIFAIVQAHKALRRY